MRICDQCFEDTELKAVVKSFKTKGKCDICGRESFVFDTSMNSSLIDIIDDFMNMYCEVKDDDIVNSHLDLENELINTWHLFSNSCKGKTKDIISAIYAYSSETTEQFDLSLFNKKVCIPLLTNEEYIQQHSIVLHNEWDKFIEDIKTKNRYHSKTINKEQLDTFIEALTIQFQPGDLFYRARISKEEGYKANELGMPPAHKAKSGRISAQGIPCFYLANSTETAINEVRAGAYDFITVAKFQLKTGIRVADLRILDRISPFLISDPVLLALNNCTLKRIKKEVEKPLRSTDNIIEYVPIQYICDYIRSKNFDGILYSSTLKSGGYNLAAFTDADFRFISKKVYCIDEIKATYNQIKKTTK